MPFTIPPFIANLPWLKIGAVLAIIAAILLYGESRADGREAKVNARWEAAAEKLQQASKDAANQAEGGALEREEDYAERLKEEKEKLDEIEAEGGDPFDALFPAG